MGYSHNWAPSQESTIAWGVREEEYRIKEIAAPAERPSSPILANLSKLGFVFIKIIKT